MLESVWFTAEMFENVYGDTHSKEHSRPQYLMELQKKNLQLFWFVFFFQIIVSDMVLLMNITYTTTFMLCTICKLLFKSAIIWHKKWLGNNIICHIPVKVF